MNFGAHKSRVVWKIILIRDYFSTKTMKWGKWVFKVHYVMLFDMSTCVKMAHKSLISSIKTIIETSKKIKDICNTIFIGYISLLELIDFCYLNCFMDLDFIHMFTIMSMYWTLVSCICHFYSVSGNNRNFSPVWHI